MFSLRRVRRTYWVRLCGSTPRNVITNIRMKKWLMQKDFNFILRARVVNRESPTAFHPTPMHSWMIPFLGYDVQWRVTNRILKCIFQFFVLFLLFNLFKTCNTNESKILPSYFLQTAKWKIGFHKYNSEHTKSPYSHYQLEEFLVEINK